MSVETVGFIGAGNMASAMIRNLVSGGIVEPSRIYAINKQNHARLENLVHTYGVTPAAGAQELVSTCSIIVLATKPFQVDEAMAPVNGMFRPGQLLVSVAAGVPIPYLQSLVGDEVPVVRAMPNTPVQVGEGAVVLSAAPGTSDADRARAQMLFEQAGRVFWTTEDQMDLVTAMSGSGPAYFYLLAEELAHAGIRLGLETTLSRELARQTLVGAGELLKRSDADAHQLLSQVATPGGTTAAALRVFEARRLGEVVAEAISSAAQRSGEMASVAERLEMRSSRRVVVKLGSPTVMQADGSFNDANMRSLVAQIARMVAQGREVVLVSSGAIACGRSRMANGDLASLTDKQVLAAIGQPLLMRHYEAAFEAFGTTVAQVLVTKEDFSSSKRADLCKNTLLRLMSKRVVPIVNENDTVAIDEIVLGDNDMLSAQVALLVSADLLVLLTDTEGLYTGDPKKSPDATVIGHVGRWTPPVAGIAGDTTSATGAGGMATKVRAAALASENGIPTVIANGATEGILPAILEGQEVGTFFSRRQQQ